MIIHVEDLLKDENEIIKKLYEFYMHLSVHRGLTNLTY